MIVQLTFFFNSFEPLFFDEFSLSLKHYEDVVHSTKMHSTYENEHVTFIKVCLDSFIDFMKLE